MTLFKRLICLAGIPLLAFACQNSANTQSENQNESTMESEKPLVLVGTYTGNTSDPASKSEGIYVYEFDSASGKLNQISATSGIENPSYLAIHPDGEHVYAVSEIMGNDTIETGLVYAYQFDKANKSLKMINNVSSNGTAPCYVSVHPSGQFAMAANYGSGTVSLMTIDDQGALTSASFEQHTGRGKTDRQETPHAHMIIPSPVHSNDVYAMDLGIDQVKVYNLNTDEDKLKEKSKTDLKPGSGPRHMAFHPSNKWTYVIDELNGTVTAFEVAEDGSLKEFQTASTLEGAEETPDAGSADIHITASGKYLYASNRSSYNNIAMYSINQDNGELTLIGMQSTKGKGPRNFVIDPSDKFLLVANQNTNSVVTFKIDEHTGKLIDMNAETAIPTPVCLKFMP